MKKFSYFAAIAIFVVSCTNGNKENGVADDTLLKTDTTAAIDSTNDIAATDTLKEDASKDATPSASAQGEKKDEKKDKDVDKDKDKDKDKETQTVEKTKPSPNAKKIDKDLKWFEHDVKQYVEAIKAGMMGYELSELREPCYLCEKKLKKYEDEMTPEQKSKFQKYQKMLHKY